MISQAGRQPPRTLADSLGSSERSTENERTASTLTPKMSCPTPASSAKSLFNSVTFRSFSYWFICSIAAAIAVGAAEPDMASTLSFTLPENTASSVLPVPEPSRALLLFAGIMAMAFTYRRAWLSWKRSPQA